MIKNTRKKMKEERKNAERLVCPRCGVNIFDSEYIKQRKCHVCKENIL